MKKSPERLEQEHLEDLERLKNLRPIDDDFMRVLFKENIPLAQMVLRIIIGKDDLILTKCNTQMDMKRVTGARSICLDVYGTDTDGRKYDLEIQRTDHGADPHRARYYASVIDMENLDAGHDFTELPDAYTIFITETDFFKQMKAIYCYRRIEETTGICLGDGSCIMYVNGEYRGDDALGRLMHDFFCSNPDDMYYKLLAERSRYYKENTEGVSEMCKAMEDMRNKAMMEGIKEGRKEGRMEGELIGKIQTAHNLLKMGMTIEQIAKAVGYQTTDVEEWLLEPATL